MTANAQALPPVTEVSFDGQQLSWDALPEASGYNVHLNFRYLTTVRDTTSYVPIRNGRYHIAAFDDLGNFSPLQIVEQNVVPTTNTVTVSDIAPPPQNTIGVVYSINAGEIFWDRVISSVLEYDVFLNGELAGTTAGTSFFIDSLLPDFRNEVAVVTRSGTSGRSAGSELIFDTSQTAYPVAATNPASPPVDQDQPLPPQNVRLSVYSLSAAELFWDSYLPSQNIDHVEITRDREVIGISPGISFFDSTRLPDITHQYELVAVRSDGVRSAPVIVNAGPFDGLTNNVIDRLLTGIADVTNNNPHMQWFPMLQRLTNDETRSEELEEISTDTFVDDNGLFVSRTTYSCGEGTLAIDLIESRFGFNRLQFDICNFDGGEIDGSVSIVGSDLGGYSVTYNNLFIDRAEGSADMDGNVALTVFRSNNGIRLNYNSFHYILQNLDDVLAPDTYVELSQSLTDILRFSSDDGPRSSFVTNFLVTAPWTQGQHLVITTNETFTDADLGNGQYVSGDLTAEASNGERMELTANTGDPSSWLATVITEESSIGIIGNWTDDTRLPCLSFTVDNEAIPGCQTLSEIR